MMLFPQTVVALLVYGALSLTGVAFVALLVMIVRDYLKKDIW